MNMSLSYSGSQIHKYSYQDGTEELVSSFSRLQTVRAEWQPTLPSVLQSPVTATPDKSIEFLCSSSDKETLQKIFPGLWGNSYVKLDPSPNYTYWENHPPLRVGVVLSGGQAPGGHNVIAGVFDYIKNCNPNSQLFGFLGGPHGVFSRKYKEIDSELMKRFRNQGGFHMICSGRHKIETQEQKAASLQVCQKLALHGLIVIGGDDSNTNAAVLAEYFHQQKCDTCIVGCPKTIDGDLKNEFIETSFGFDTATKTYSELVGNLMTDVVTSRNRYHFVRLMGRSASNIALECAMQTRPNLCFIGEEIQKEKRSLQSIVDEIVQLVEERHHLGKHYGVILVPEGLVEFIPEIGTLIQELNDLLSTGESFDSSKLTAESCKVFHNIPEVIRKTLLLERDPHGNVQVAKISTEQLLSLMTQTVLEKKGLGNVFRTTCHYFGYEGRCALPSLFDSNYCYALGHTAGALMSCGLSGYMAVVRRLFKRPRDWEPAGCPLQVMMTMERRKGKEVPVISKYLVELQGSLFKMFSEVRASWRTGDFYRCPGPIQYCGPTANSVNYLVEAPRKEQLCPRVPFNLEALKQRYSVIKSLEYLSPLQRERLSAEVEVPHLLLNPKARAVAGRRCPIYDQQGQKFVTRAFPLQCNLHKMKIHNIIESSSSSTGACFAAQHDAGLRIGVVLQGQQAPGSSNVLHGLFERLKLISWKSVLIGFKGVHGLLENDAIEITREDLKLYFNQGGFELLGRTKESKPLMRQEHGLSKVLETCQTLRLDGLVMIGGQTSLTDAALVAEHLLLHNCKTHVIGVPATQENNLRHSLIEACIGFDSTSKCYASLVGNLLIDAASATKYWYFIRLMGQVPSHMVLEASLQTHPNMCIISEKYAEFHETLYDIVNDICQVVCARSSKGKDFGAVLIPEGLISQLPHFKELLLQLNSLLREIPEDEYDQMRHELIYVAEPSKYIKKLDPWVTAMWKLLPEFFREQLLQRSEIDISEVSIEQLLSQMVAAELARRKEKGEYTGTFSPVCHYLGFQGRSTMPSQFDCRLGLAYGYLACMAVEAQLTGYVVSIRGLCGSWTSWTLSAVPIAAVMKVMPEKEMKAYGREVPMVPCGEVDLQGKTYIAFKSAEETWETEDCFCNPGPIQFHGKTCDSYNRTLFEEQYAYLKMLHELELLIKHIMTVCTFGVDESTLRTAVLSLEGVRHLLSHTHTSGSF